MLKEIRKENRKLNTLKLRDALLHTKIAKQQKKVDALINKVSKEDLFLYKEQFEKMAIKP